MPRGLSPRTSSAIASETHEIASARRATRRASCSFTRLSGTGGSRVRAAMLVRDDRISEVGEPARSGRFLDGRPDEVDRPRRRRRDHRVDSLSSRDPNRGRDRGDVPGDARIRHEQAASRHLRLDERAVEALAWRSSSAGLRAWAQVPHAVDPGLGGSTRARCRGAPTSDPRAPARASRSQRRQVLRELQRALDTPAAGGREVHGDEQHLQRGRRVDGRV